MRRLRLTIIGTKVDLDPTGLPSRLEGDIFEGPPERNGGEASRPRAGGYSEEVEPILNPGLSGARGVSRLELPGGAIVTENFSSVRGTAPDGSLLVVSTGRVVGAEGCFRGVEGTLRSESAVRLNPFRMTVAVTLRLGGRSATGSRSRRLARGRSSGRFRRGSHPQASW